MFILSSQFRTIEQNNTHYKKKQFFFKYNQEIWKASWIQFYI